MWHSTSGPETHFVLEALAYLIGGRLYWRQARRQTGPALPDRLVLLAAAIGGALLGSKLLHVAEHFTYLSGHADLRLWLSGKSVLGGLLGGTLATEIAKKAIGWTQPTGNAWLDALTAGLIIGRLGCQLSGTWDQTYGTPAGLPWAWDYGDGVGRHPTGFYEMILIGLAWWLARRPAFFHRAGAGFAVFMLAYCVIRLGLEFLKPPFGAAAADALPIMRYAGLTAIQWCALAGIAWHAVMLKYRLRNPKS